MINGAVGRSYRAATSFARSPDNGSPLLSIKILYIVRLLHFGGYIIYRVHYLCASTTFLLLLLLLLHNDYYYNIRYVYSWYIVP